MFRFDRQELRSSLASVHAEELSVRFQDIDAAGIVFFATVFDYFHAAYEGFLRRAGCPLPEALTHRLWAAPLRHAEADYFAPLLFGDQLSIHIGAAHVEETEIVLGYRVVRADGTVCAVGQTVHTFVNPETRKRCSVPAEIVSYLAPLLG